MDFKKNIIWIDGLGGLIVGILVLVFQNWLSTLYSLPLKLVVIIGIVNLIYGSYSTYLALWSKFSEKHILFLAFANMAWTIVCLVLLGTFAKTASIFGLLLFILEGLYVGGLGVLEFRWRKYLSLNP